MRLEIINTGSELVYGYTLNSHIGFINNQLLKIGLLGKIIYTVADGEEILTAFTEATSRADIVIITGGLGPTADDVTKELIAENLGMKLVKPDDLLNHVIDWLSARSKKINSGITKQIYIPEGAEYFKNYHGIAPGIFFSFQKKSRTVCALLLPGPPGEMQPMLTNQVIPFLKKRLSLEKKSYKKSSEELEFAGNEQFRLKTYGLAESLVGKEVEKTVSEFNLSQDNVTLCSNDFYEVDLYFNVTKGLRENIIAKLAEDLENYLIDKKYSTIEQKVIKLASEKKLLIAGAESCTGGHIADRLTNVPGASAVFVQSCVTYANSAKENLLGVSSKTLNEHGAVSEQCAFEMARGCLKIANADLAYSVTGIAGPSGGTKNKPVGTAFIGIAAKDKSGNDKVFVERYLNPMNTDKSDPNSNRLRFKKRLSSKVLDLLRNYLSAGKI